MNKWTTITTNACVSTKGKNLNTVQNIIKHIERKSYEELQKHADVAADEKAKYDAQLLQAFKDKKLKSKSLIKEAQLLKKAEDKKLKEKAKKEEQSK